MTDLMMGGVAVPIQAANEPLPAAIYIIRHGDKPKSRHDRELSIEGWQRVAMLTREAGNLFPGLGFVFATSAEGGQSCREIETARPLALALRLPEPNCKFAKGSEQQLAEFIKGHAEIYGGRVLLIVWHHSEMPALLSRLGYPGKVKAPRKDEYDQIWRLTYPGMEKPLFAGYHQPQITGADKDSADRLKKKFGGCTCEGH